MNKCILVLLSGIFFAYTSCKREVENIALPNTDIVLKDVAYGDDSLQKMDVYLPANRAPQTKIIVFLHGGSWYTGDKAEAEETAKYFQRKGYAFISMNYRLTSPPGNKSNPAQMEDIRKALDLISSRHLKWIITGNRICLFGGSAGAHLSLLYGYKNCDDERVKAIIAVSAPINLSDSNMRNTPFKAYRERFVGARLSENKEAWDEASPSHFISAHSAPTLLFQGTQDAIVPYRQAVSAYNELKRFGANAELNIYTGLGHDLAPVREEILEKSEKFIKSAYR